MENSKRGVHLKGGVCAQSRNTGGVHLRGGVCAQRRHIDPLRGVGVHLRGVGVHPEGGVYIEVRS